MIGTDYQSLSGVAERVARLAGQALAVRAEDWLAVGSSAKRDIKLVADRAAEHIILEELAATGIGVLSEEAGAIEGVEGKCRWVVDPLDGTYNYARNLPLSCVAIALIEDDCPVLGVVYDFSRSEMFSGIVGQGAWLNGKPIRVSCVEQTDAAVLATGLPAKRDFSVEAMEGFGRSLARWKKVRMLGSAALSLAYVAAGRVDAYSENAIMPWDVAAGIALVEAAGGAVHREGSFNGQPLDVISTNPHLLEVLSAS